MWPGFVDLRAEPARIVEIAEAAALPALASLLLALNAAESPVWTSKCDMWEPEPETTADMRRERERCVPLGDRASLLPSVRCGVAAIAFPERGGDGGLASGFSAMLPIGLIVRRGCAGEVEGFGVTAYLGACGRREAGGERAIWPR